MPYVQVVTSKRLTAQEKAAIKSSIGELIGIIPGKSESVLMVGFFDGTDLFYGGNAKENGAFVGVNLHGDASFEKKSALTETLFAMMKSEIGVSEEDMFLTIQEYPNWGFCGKFL
jgi:phenylpyruvate tautomerase PptA (4-oxalocrotonate tautomerase family)